MKKMAAIILSLIMGASVFAFSGCNSNKDDGSLVVWIQSVNQPEFFAWAKTQFESENPGAKIRVSAKLQGALGDSLDVTLGDKNAPDMAATWGGLVVNKLVKGNKVENVDNLIKTAVGDNLNEAADLNKQDGNGQHYSIPLHGFLSPVIYYNKTFFTQKGLKPPTTYEEMVALSATITANSKLPLVAGFSTWHLPHFMQAIHSRTMTPENYAKLLSQDKTANPFTLPGYKEGWDLFKLMQTDKIFANNITGYDANTASAEFISQKAVMFTAPSLDLYSLNDATTFDMGTFLLPPAPASVLPSGLTQEQMKDAPLASGLYSDVFIINANSKKKDLAFKFSTFLLSQKAQSKLLEFDLLPVRTDVSLDGANEILKPVVAEMANGVSGFYQNFAAPAIDLKLLDAGQRVLGGQMTTQAAADFIAKFYKDEVMDK